MYLFTKCRNLDKVVLFLISLAEFFVLKRIISVFVTLE